MKTTKAQKSGPWLIFVGDSASNSTRTDSVKTLFDACASKLPPTFALIYMNASVSREEWASTHVWPWEGKSSGASPTQVLLIWDKLPVNAQALVTWKDYLLADRNMDHSIVICPHELSTHDAFATWLKQQLLRHHVTPPDAAETPRLCLGDYVTIPADAHNAHVHASFISLAFGPMQDVVERLSYWRQRYLDQVAHVGDRDRKAFRESLLPLLKSTVADADDEFDKFTASVEKLKVFSETRINPSALPVLLLTGETGTGKTLLAKYLARLSAGATLPFQRIPVPEYEASENMFEHEVFGYAAGDFSGASPTGSRGVLLDHICGVIFLDEIGDASSATQRKLLAYMDDYHVRPRGLSHSIYCPTMIVAATNCDLAREVTAKRFRRDLYERFDVRIHVPPLNERKSVFSLILDTILQDPGINPNRRVTEISSEAYELLAGLDYTDGNFRRLQTMFRAGIQTAVRHNRRQLTQDDLGITFQNRPIIST